MMNLKRENPGALAGATGAMVTIQAAPLNVIATNSIIPGEMHHAMQRSRLRHRHRLSGPRCDVVAMLACGREVC